MAVEAQVCPQCGAAVQFAPGQTEVICGHCGTTVAKTAAPGAATVEKELADEVLIQAMVAREHKLHAHGRPAAAKIVSTQVKNIFRNTLGGRSVVIVFALEVQPDGEPAFTAEAQALVGLVAVEKYKPGILLNVKFDPQDNSQVAIDGRRGSDGNTVKSPEQHREDRAKKREAKEQAQLTAKQAAPSWSKGGCRATARCSAS